MRAYDPQTVLALASIVEDIYKALQNGGAPLKVEMKEAIAKRVLQLFESGVTNPDHLRLAIMADGLWALSRDSDPEPLSPSQH